MMKLVCLQEEFSVCKGECFPTELLKEKFCFFAKTDEECSIVCETRLAPNVKDREDGWKGFRIEGVLDFSLIGILSKIATVLAESKISVFAVSTFNTDYIFVRKQQFYRAMERLSEQGYEVF